MGASSILDSVFLPGVHPQVASAVGRQRLPEPVDSLGIVETRTVAAAIAAADAGLKGAEVNLIEVRLADGLGGKGLVFFSGLVHDVEAAVHIGVECISSTSALIQAVVIPQLHPDMAANILADTRWQRQHLGSPRRCYVLLGAGSPPTPPLRWLRPRNPQRLRSQHCLRP